MTAGWSIRRRLVLLVIVISSLIIVATVLIILQSASATIRNQQQTTLYMQERDTALRVDEQIQRMSEPPRLLASMLADPALTPIPDLWRTISNMMLDTPWIGRIGLLRPYRSGYQIVQFRRPFPTSKIAPLSRDYTQTIAPDSWYAEAMSSGRTYWHSVIAGEQPHAAPARYVIAIPMRVGDSGAQGLVWIEVSAADMREVVQSTLASNENAAAHLVLDGDRVIAAFGLPMTMTDRTGNARSTLLSSPDFSRWLESLPTRGQSWMDDTDPLSFGDTRAAFVTAHDLPTSHWRMISVFSPSALQDPEVQVTLFVLIVALVGLLILGMAVQRAVNYLVSLPLMEISRAAQEIGSGDMRYHIAHINRGDEVGSLARALDAMQRNLADTYGRLSMYGRTLEQRVAERTSELDMARQFAQNNASEMRTLYDASIDLVSEYQLDVMLQKLVGYVRTLLRAGYCSVWLLNDDGRQLRLVATTPEYRHVVGVVIPSTEGIAGRVVRIKKGMTVENYTTWAGRIGWIMPQMHRAVGVPLLYSGNAIGAVVAGRGPMDPPFEEPDQRLLNLLANLVSPIVRNAQLFGQLEETNQRIELASEVKTRFLASITHELRTPLNLVINNMDFMRIGIFGEVTEEQRERLDQTIRSAEGLLYLINDLLDVSKIEAGEMQLFIQPTDVYPMIVDTLDAAIALVPDNSPVAIMADIPEALPEVPMDARRIRQVLLNLLSNAIKFTEQGEIWLRVHLVENDLEFVVSDTGAGIPQTEMERIFQPFERTSHAREMGIEGTGLGLPISRWLVEAHGGTMTVESQVGQGSVFRFSIPINPPQKRRTAQIKAAMAEETR
ncbi:MAG: GAF domain-containing protein [Anaerolineae bacterium]|nr:GAF domain-containing protein [Anaerolineae bacterium]